jgi:carboxymethylenebutenolidase
MVGFSTAAGEAIEGVLCEPAGSGKASAIVVVHEGYGLAEATKLRCEEFAEAGFLAFAPDLFRGKVAKNEAEMGELMATFDFQKAVRDVGEAASYLRSHSRSTGKVAIAGFSLGGALTLAAARYVPVLEAVIAFYGLPRIPSDELAKVKTPICGHYARVDDWANPALVEEVQGKVRSNGGRMDVHFYDAKHGFMRSTDSRTYDPKCAELAWKRTLDFLHERFG